MTSLGNPGTRERPMLRLLHWNILHGGGSRRMPHIVLALLEHKPDVVLLSEYRTTIGGQIRGILADHGLLHQATTAPARHKNGLLLASNRELKSPPKPADPPAGQQSRWLDVAIADEDILLTGVHVPDDSRASARAAFWLGMVELARARADCAHLFFGDFNTGRHHADEQGATFTCTRHLGTVCSLGYADAYRVFEPSAREWTWLAPGGSRAKPEKTGVSSGFRIDSALVSRPLLPRLAAARYSHAGRESGVSDHSSMLLDFSPAPKPDQKSTRFVQETAIF